MKHHISLPSNCLPDLCDEFSLQLLVLTGDIKYLKMYKEVISNIADVYDECGLINY